MKRIAFVEDSRTKEMAKIRAMRKLPQFISFILIYLYFLNQLKNMQISPIRFFFNKKYESVIGKNSTYFPVAFKCDSETIEDEVSDEASTCWYSEQYLRKADY